MRKGLGVLICFVFLFALFASPSNAEKKWNTWNEISDQMVISLNKAYDSYAANDAKAAKDWVNDAYFGYYEKEGFERAVMSYISGKRASTVEYQFSAVKKLITSGAPKREVRASLDGIIKMLQEDSNKLDGKEDSPWTSFVASLIIIVREGFEAILVIAAIAAYLTRSGNGTRNRTVYGSAILAIVASAVMAYALQRVISISGANQELLEGVTMLLAVVVLFFVSNWMISKAEAEAWKHYIEGKVQTAITTGSSFALAAAAFLAVFREGAETILFYQALIADAGENIQMVWYGFGVGCIILVILFALIRYGSLMIPIRVFFIGTSILMYIMSIAFAGGGVKELQEADVVGVTPVDFVGSVDILGIYPTVETLVPQVVLLALAILSILYYRSKGKSAGKIAS